MDSSVLIPAFPVLDGHVSSRHSIFDGPNVPNVLETTYSYIQNFSISSTADTLNPPSPYDATFINFHAPIPPNSLSYNSVYIEQFTISPASLQRNTPPRTPKLGNTDLYLGDRGPFSTKRLTPHRRRQLPTFHIPPRHYQDSSVASPISSTPSDSSNSNLSSPTDENPFSVTNLYNTPFTPTIPPALQTHYEALLRLFTHSYVSTTEYKKALKPFYVDLKRHRTIDGRERKYTVKRCLLCAHVVENATQIYQHLLDHFGIYPFRCKREGCAFSSTRSADLIKHVQEQHEPNLGHTCSLCGDVIRHKRNMKRHWDRCHPSPSSR